MTHPNPKPPSFGPPFKRIGLVVALALLAAAPARATGIQFATFDQTGTRDFAFTSQSGSAKLQTVNQSNPSMLSTQVVFTFTAASGQDTTPHNATLTLTAPTTTPAFLYGPTMAGIDQPISGPGTLTVTDNSNGQNLLTLTFNGDIEGKNGDQNAALSGDSATGNTVVYSSNVTGLSFTPGGSYLIGLPTVTPFLSINSATGFLNDFTSNGNGSFSGTLNAVPVPPSVVMLGTGALVPAGLSLLRRKRQAKPALVAASV